MVCRILVYYTLLITTAGTALAAELRGTYLESRTCQVYTGPCFANAEMGQTGKNAILGWNIAEGSYHGVDLAGLSVVAVIDSSDTLGFSGLEGGREMKSILMVDRGANPAQREALIQFAREQIGRAGQQVVRVETQPIAMDLDIAQLRGSLQAGNVLRISTRKAQATDCICGNEIAYYPPLARLERFAPGVAVDNEFSGIGLNSRWSAPESRSAYVGTFAMSDRAKENLSCTCDLP